MRLPYVRIKYVILSINIASEMQISTINPGNRYFLPMSLTPDSDQ
jgi:hypothetical protein